MASDPRDPGFTVAAWEASLAADRLTRAEAQRRRDADWREEQRTRLKPKDGTALEASFVSVPVPDPAPGAPRLVPVRRG